MSERADGRQGEIGLDGQRKHEALILPILGDEGDSSADGLGDRPDTQPLSIDGDTARRVRVRAEDRSRHLGPSGPDESGQPDDLAGAHGKPYVGECSGPCQSFHSEDRRAVVRSRIDVLRHRARREVASNHLTDQRLPRDLVRADGVDKLAVAQDRDAVGKGEYLVHAVTDIKESDTFIAQPPDIRE